MRPLTRGESRRVDEVAIRECGMSGLVLMENAARGCAEIAREMLSAGGPVAVLCGKGNNGGDGFAMARHLDNAGVSVRVFAVCDADEMTPDAAANFRLLQWTGCEVRVCGEVPKGLEDCGLVVDAMLGTGASGSPRPPLDGWIDAANACGSPILALDVPSGLDCDTGEPAGPCVRAAVTATFVAEKVGYSTPAAAAVLGRVRVVDIGVPRGVLSRV